MPLAARLNVQVIDDINNAIAGSRPDRSRDLEIGGILLGSIEAEASGSRPTVYVERFQPVISEHRRGPSYVLSDRDKKELAKKLEWWSNNGGKEGLRPVGFFRSHTRRGLYLDNDDFAVLQQYFSDPTSLFLLVRPVAGAASVGGFFFWGKSDIHRETSYQEFPFDSKHLPLVSAERAPQPEERPTTRALMRPTPQAILEPVAAAAANLVRRQPFWLQIAVPLVVGVGLGVVVFAVTTHGTAPRTTVRTAQNGAPAGSAKSGPRAPGANPGTLQKPSPLEPKSRPIMVGPTVPPEAEPAKVPVAKPVTTADRTKIFKPSANPMGSASRVNTAPNSEPVPAAVLAPPPVVTSTHPPAAPLAFITAPARVENLRRPAPVATVTVEAVSGSKLGRIVGKIPGFRRRQEFIPARPIHQVAPAVPTGERLERSVPVDLRVTVDHAGHVAVVEQASRGADSELVRLATDAARGWQFVPARKNDETVTSEVILHFTFPGSGSVEQ